MSRVLVLGSYAESLITFRGPLLQKMVSEGHRVYAAAPNASVELQQQLSDYGVTYCDVYLSRTGINPVSDLRTLFALYSLMKRIKPEYVLGYTIKPVIYGSIAAKLAGVPNINSMITGLGYSFSSSGIKANVVGAIARSMFKLALWFNKRIFFQNNDNRRVFEENGLIHNSEQVVIINGSGVLLDYFVPVPFPETISFLLIARLLYEKGILEYSAAASIIKKKYPNITFNLVGWLDESPDCIKANDLQRWIKEGTINFLGKLDDVRPAIGSSSVYVLPSYHEGTPRTVLEAMAMGRPIITTDAPGCRETVVDGKNGFLVPVKNADALASAMETLIREPSLFETMGKQSRELAEKKYNVHNINSAIMKSMGL